MMKEKRGKVRLRYPVVILVTTRYDQQYKGVVRDIGIESLYFYADGDLHLEAGDRLDLRIILLGADSRLVIEAVGTVIRADSQGFAVRFTRPLEWWPLFSLFPQHRLGASPQGGGRVSWSGDE